MKNVIVFIFCINWLSGQNNHLMIVKPNEILLWSTNIPENSQLTGTNKISPKGSYTNVTTPLLVVHKPELPNGLAVLVISGGGYSHIASGNEGYPVSQWLNSLGITAFELIYRLPGENENNRQVPFQDAQRAMRMIRNYAVTYKINPEKIGILGFSAGGHLAGYISSMSEYSFYKPQDSLDFVSARPDFCGLIYPIVSMQPINSKTNSFKNLLGPNPSKENENLFSVEKQVNSHTPPTFIAQSVDDPVSPIENSLLIFHSLREQKIPVEMHLFQTGGHGWGMGKSRSETLEWPKLFLNWLKQNKILEY